MSCKCVLPCHHHSEIPPNPPVNEGGVLKRTLLQHSTISAVITPHFPTRSPIQRLTPL